MVSNLRGAGFGAPEGRLIVARRFNAGFAAREIPVPSGRMNRLHARERSISTYGTRIIRRIHPPLKWRATIRDPAGPTRTIGYILTLRSSRTEVPS